MTTYPRPDSATEPRASERSPQLTQLGAHNQAKPEVGAGDFEWALRAMRDLLAGRDPYGYVPGPYAIPYPLPSAFAALPVAWMPDVAAASVFFGLSVLLFGYCVFLNGDEWRLAML